MASARVNRRGRRQVDRAAPPSFAFRALIVGPVMLAGDVVVGAYVMPSSSLGIPAVVGLPRCLLVRAGVIVGRCVAATFTTPDTFTCEFDVPALVNDILWWLPGDGSVVIDGEFCIAESANVITASP